MVKKNYGNRASSKGIKLGEIIARDLRKHAWHASTHSTLAGQRRAHPLELGISGGNLTDDGFRMVCDALEEILRPSSSNCHIQLESLDLSRNELTTKALSALINPLKLARFDIKDLDVSENKIKILDEDDADIWERFLGSFDQTPILLRINFEGNDFNHSRALEILYRVYNSPSSPGISEGNGVTWSSEFPRNSTDKLAEAAADITLKWKALGFENCVISPGRTENSPGVDNSTLCSFPMVLRRHGLSNIPYLVLRDTNLTDAGALLLSYIVEKHALPQLLNPTVKVTHLTKILHEYHRQSQCRGIIYLPNKRLSKDSISLLQLAEQHRTEFPLGKDEAMPHVDQASGVVDFEANTMPIFMGRKLSGSVNHESHARTPSVASSSSEIPHGDIARTRVLDLDRLRAKIQRTTIRDNGTRSIDLWTKSLRFLVVSRCITNLQNTPSIPRYMVWVDKSQATTGPTAPPMLQMISHLDKGLIETEQHNHLAAVRHFTERSKVSPSELAAWRKVPENYKQDTRLFKRLPLEIWARIITEATCAHGIVSEKQQMRVIRYAMDKGNLKLELQRLGKETSHQIWTLLDGIGCLTYDRPDETQEGGGARQDEDCL